MKKKIPLIYAPKVDKKINNNKEVYYSYLDNNKEKKVEKIEKEEILSEFEMQKKIDQLFRSNDFIYKKKFLIKTKDGEKEYTIISKSYDYLLTIEGNRIMIKDIISIKG